MMKFFSLLVCTLLLGLTGCLIDENLEEAKISEYQGEFAIPLFQSSTPILEVLENVGKDAYAGVNEDSLVAIIYRGDVQRRTSADLFGAFTDFPFPVPIVTNPFEFALPSDEFKLNSALFDEGEIYVNFYSSILDSLYVIFTVENLIRDGEPFRIYSVIPNEDGTASPLEEKRTPAGYTLIPDKDTIRFSYTAKNLRTDSFVSIDLITFQLRNAGISYAEGFLTNQFYDLPRDTVFIDLFEKWVSGNIQWINPSITVFIDNSFGFPLQIQTSTFNVQTLVGPKQKVDAPLLDSFDIAFPNFSEIGESKSTILRIDPSNSSNIESIINEGPLWVEYDLDAETNANAGEPDLGFATDSSSLRVGVQIELPLHGNFRDFTTIDTIDLNFSNYEDADEVEFKWVSENEVPLDFRLQARFIDDQGLIIDSLLDSPAQVMKGAPVGPDGVSIGTSSQTVYIPISTERFQNIKRATRVLLESQFTSTGQESGEIVKVLPDQEIRIRMGGIFRFGSQ
jgi:hypothetical protein